MNKEDKKESKFSFVTMEELEKVAVDLNNTESEDSRISVIDMPEKVNVSSFESVSDDGIENKNESGLLIDSDNENEVIDDSVENMEDEKSEEVEEQDDEQIDEMSSSPAFDNSKSVNSKIHFSFEARIITMVLLILLMFLGSCFLILEAINYGDDNNVSYNEISKVHYEVCLLPNTDYANRCLDEEMEYVSSLIDTIHGTFHYNVDFSSAISYDVNYRVVALMKIYDRLDKTKVLYKNEDVLVDKTNLSNTSTAIDFDTDVVIDYDFFNKKLAEYKNRYSLNDAMADLDVVLYLDDPNETRSVGKLTIPLGTQTFGISTAETSNLNKSAEAVRDNWTSYNTICASSACFLILISMVLLYKTTRLVLKVTTSRNKYQTLLTQILREYDRIIVIARDGYESNVKKKVIKVANFDELLDARDTLEKPIIYSRVNDVKSEFIVEDDEKLFKFILKESDL